MAYYKAPKRKFSAIVYGHRTKLHNCDGLHKLATFLVPYYIEECYGPYKYRTIIKVIKEYSDSTPNFSALQEIGKEIISFCRICNDDNKTRKRPLNSRQRTTFIYIAAKTLEPYLEQYYKKINNKIGS